MMHTPLVAICCVVLASLLGAAGQYLFKAGSARSASTFGFMFTHWAWTGMACYIVIMFLFGYAFRRGGTVSVLYPIYATTFIWAAIIGWLFYRTSIQPIHVVGMVLLIAGVYCMTRDGSTVPPAAALPILEHDLDK